MEKLRSIFNFIYGYYLDYRYKVPPASALSFAYYMILSIIPICTLLAFFTPFFPLDIKTAQEILSYYLRPDVTKMVIQLIEPRSLSITTITTLIASIFVVSRGFYQLHRISKNMFPNDKEYSFFIDQGITFLKTILIFILILAVISLLIIFPFFKIIFIDQHNFITRVLFLFIIIFVILFLLYKIIPDQNVDFLDTIKGTVVATLLIELIIGILSIYFSIVDYSNVYGPLAALVMLMFSIAVCSEAIYFGMYVIFECHIRRLIKKL